MSNNLIFTIMPVNKQLGETKNQSVFFMRDYNKVIYVTSTGSVLTYILENKLLKKEALLRPDFLQLDFKMINFSIILSPFNVFRQNGKWTLVGLYNDGKLRFWDIDQCKCYLVSKNNEFGEINNVLKMGSVLSSKKRFIYFIKTDKSLKSQLIIFDAWTMKKISFNIPTDFQIVDVAILKNDFYLLDVDQKVICIEADFLSDPNYLQYDDVSIHENSIRTISEQLARGAKTIYIPIRTTNRRFDAVLTEKDYDLKNYKFLRFFDESILFFAKSSFLMISVEAFLNSEDLSIFENASKFTNKYPAINVFFNEDINLKNVFVEKMNDQSFFFIVTEDNKIYYLYEEILKFASANKDNDGCFVSPLTFQKRDEKRIDLKIEMNLIHVEQDQEIRNIFVNEQGVFILLSEIESFKFVSKDDLKKMNNMILQELAGNKEKEILNVIVESYPDRLANDRKGLHLKIYDLFSDSFQSILSFQDFLNMINQKIKDDDVIISEFVCNFKGRKDSFYLLATQSGDIILVPLFFGVFSDCNYSEIYFLKTNIKDIYKVLVKNGVLIISDSDYLYGFDLSNNNNWNKTEKIVLKNFFKKIFKSNRENVNSELEEISILLMEGNFSEVKKSPIKGKLEKIDNINLYKKTTQEKELLNFLENIKILIYENRNIQILFVEEFHFLLEHFTHENKLVSVLCDECSNFLYMCFEDGIVEVFRMEIKSIISVINYSKNSKMHSSLETELGIQNAIKSLFEHLKTIQISVVNKSILGPLFENYYNSFSDFNNINWFSQSNIIKKSKFNDIILYHFKYFFNYFNMCFNDFHKYNENSDIFVHQIQKAFGEKTEEEEEKKKDVSGDPFKIIQMNREKENSTIFSKNNLFSLSLKNFHHFLNNLSLDRFQFLREKFGMTPIIFLLLKNKEEIAEQLKNKIHCETDVEEVFQQLYEYFLRDSFSNNLKETLLNEIMYLKLPSFYGDISALSFNPQLIFKNDSEWKVEYLSIFFQQFLFENPDPSESFLNFAKSFNLKIPSLRMNLCVQGLGNSITYFLPDLDSKNFYGDLLQRNDLLHTTILTTMTSFLLSYPYIPQNISHKIAFELFHQFIVQRRSEINIFVLVLYFFNDNLLLSASTHFLLNKLSLDKDLYLKKLKVSFHIRKKILDIFFKQIKKIKTPSEELSKLELALLMIILLTLPDSEWSTSNAIKTTINNFIDQVYPNNCITNAFFVISVLKFLIKTVSKLVKYLPPAILETLTKNLHYICLYYGLSLDSKHDEISVLHKGLYENKLKLNSKMYTLLQEISYQPLVIRMSLRKHSTKIIKILSDENLTLVLSVFHKLLEDYDHFFFTHINILDLIRYLVRFDDQKLKKRLDLIVQLILKSLDPHKPELRSKCQEYATTTLKSILKRYTFTSFNQLTQHFAVSNHKYHIVIYDLKMALEWKVLKGHNSFIDVISISDNGKYLASFSFLEKRFIVWEIDHQGFFASILHRSNQILYDVNLTQQIREKIDLLGDLEKLKWDIRFIDKKHFILREKNSKMKITINA